MENDTEHMGMLFECANTRDVSLGSDKLGNNLPSQVFLKNTQ
jgi:hypothetical protein